MEQVVGQQITAKDREMARTCAGCKVCRHARAHPGGVAYWFVKNVEGGLCPYCKAYEKVYGRKAHEQGGRTEED
ncbi:MAG: hypothetical protein ACYC4L_10570 [Chloroflexota bacterium]